MRTRHQPLPPDADETMPIQRQRPVRERPIVAIRDRPPFLLLYPFFVWLVHSVVVIGAAATAYRYGTTNPNTSEPSGRMPTALDGWAGILVEPLRHWDGLWYRSIALEGYEGFRVSVETIDGLHYEYPYAAFWPTLPVAMRYIERATGLAPEVGGFLVANISFFVALVFVYRLTALDFDVRIAKRTLWVLALFPTALFFSAVYTEAPFLMFAAGSMLYARTGKWWLAGILGLLAALTRSYGVFLGLPLGLLLLRQYGFYLRDIVPRLPFVAMPALGPLIFAWHLERVLGNWRAFIDVQSMWNRTFAWPWETMRCAVSGCELTLTQYGQTRDWTVDGANWNWLDRLVTNPRWDLIASQNFRRSFADSDTLELIFTILFLVLAVVGLKLLPLYHSAWVIPGLVVPLFSPSTVHPLMSMPRFGLTLFPLFIVLALLLRGRPLRVTYFAFSTALLVVLSMQFANWYWVS
jgi:hypothetical protein